MVKLSHTTQILSQVFKKPNSLCTVQDSFDVPCTVQSELGFFFTLHSDSLEEFISNLAYCQTPSGQ